MPLHPDAELGFARNADDYERARPPYPPEAFDRLARALGLGPGRAVADVAATTATSSRRG